ncbi:protein disulfide isomerase-like 1-3 [Malania oleifera]|uniref:protein disulfide isomerase-like 1-3 n=1 Tax=Malania oleifera TaxID=397392 RepID=UPI0025AE1ED6|nr:protein disulfide isomerase-like 1-3 [Malania oleifera]
MANRVLILLLPISILLLLNAFSSAITSRSYDPNEDDDLQYLESEEEKDASSAERSSQQDEHESDEDSDEDPHIQMEPVNDDDQEPDLPPMPDYNEKDVVELEEKNFDEYLRKKKHVVVEFYAPWCQHCQNFAPEFAAAATELKGEAVLAKVDASKESKLAQNYQIQGIPTLLLFSDGAIKIYKGPRTKDDVVAWVKKKTGPSLPNLTTTEEAERVLAAEPRVVLGFFDTLKGPESDELAAASKEDDDVVFYQSTSIDVAKIFHIDSHVKRPALVLIKKEDEKISHFDGQFTKEGIAKFVLVNKIPMVVKVCRETTSLVFGSPITKQLVLLIPSSGSEKLIPVFQEAAKAFQGKIIFLYLGAEDEEVWEQGAEYFGVTGNVPKVFAYSGDKGKKYALDGELTLSNIKSFAQDFLANKLKPVYKSDPIPETNDEDVKVVVGKNFDEIVLDESKDVLLEIYAPWCGHCLALEPIYKKLGKYLRGINSLVVAKMDGTRNEHPRALISGFPTFLFFPAGNKSSDPIRANPEQSVVAYYTFLKKHASIPFKLQRPGSTQEFYATDDDDGEDDDVDSAIDDGIDSDVDDSKDEL